jgi:hypothetical protein
MVLWRKFRGRSLVMGMALMLGTTVTRAWGLAPGSLGSFGGELRGITQLKGKIICVRCSLEEARAAQRNPRDLYVLRHGDEQVVIRVDSFADPSEVERWEDILGPSHELSVRAPQRVFEELTAEENLFKEVVLTGLLRSTRTLDVGSVKVIG